MQVQTDFATFLRGLRSVRRYAATPIPDTVLQDIVDVGRWTGSAKNTQPWEAIVVRDPGVLRELATCGTFASHLAGAQAVIGLIMDDSTRRLDEGRLAQNVMLAAWAHGVGSCIGTLQPTANAERAKALLGVPAERDLRTTIALGYPADEQALRRDRSMASVVPLGRKRLEEFVSWERYGQRQP